MAAMVGMENYGAPLRVYMDISYPYANHGAGIFARIYPKNDPAL